MNSKNTMAATGGLILAMLLWGSAFAVTKFAILSYDPMVVIWGRMSIAPIIFFIFRKQIIQFTYQKGDWKYILGLSLFEPCLYFVFEAYALVYTTASQAGMITAIMPLMVVVAAAIFLKEKTSLRAIIGIVVAIVGIVVITLGGSSTETASNPVLGNMLEIMAMVCGAGYTITAKHLSSRYSSAFLVSIQMSIGAVFFTPVLFFPTTTLPTEFTLVPSLAIVYLGTIVSFGAYGLYNYGLSKISASEAVIYINLIPVFAFFWGWLFLSETFSVVQTYGAIVVFAGVLISSYTQFPKRFFRSLAPSRS